jgi:hypothetical protein
VFKRLAVMGCLGTVLPILLVIAGLLVAGDVAARRYATGQLSDRIGAAVPEASGVHARIHSFPFIGRLLLDQSVQEVGAHIDRLAAVHGLVFTGLDVDLRGVVLDRGELISHQQVRLRRIRQGTVTVALTQQALADALGRPVTITGGVVNVTVLGGRAVHASVSVAASKLAVEVSPLPVATFPLPNSKVLPCAPRVQVVETQIILACTFTRIPPAFVPAA